MGPCLRRGTASLPSALLQMPTPQQFGDLHRVQRRALAEIVRHAPEVQTVFDRRILAHAADKGREVADAFDGGYVAAVLALVVEHDARPLAQDALRLPVRTLVLHLVVDRFRMTDEDGTPDERRGAINLRLEDSLGLDAHLPIILVRTVVAELVNVPHNVNIY